MRFLHVFLTVALFSSLASAQWVQSTALTGGSIIATITDFDSDLYLSTSNAGIYRLRAGITDWEKTSVPVQGNLPRLVVHDPELLAISFDKVFRTSDGENWTENAGPSGFINGVSSDGTTIAAATSNGLYLSSDAGVTWLLSSETALKESVAAVAVSGTTIWASATSPGGTLFKSTDSGTTWSTLTKGTATITGIFINGADVFINANYDGIYKSTDQGSTWQLLRASTSETEFFAGQGKLFAFSSGKLSISTNAGATWVDKTDLIMNFSTETLFATASSVYLGCWGGGVFETDSNGNDEWEQINNGLLIQEINALVVVDNIIYAGTEHSFVRDSEDEGVTWGQQRDANNFSGSNARVMTSHGDDLFVGQGGGGIHRSSNGGTNWVLKNQGLVSQNILGFASLGSDLYALTNAGIYKSTDRGDNWTVKAIAPSLVYRTLYTDGKYLYVGTFTGLFLSKDKGENWTSIGAGLGDQSVGKITHVGSTLFAASQFNGLYKTSDLGTSWTQVSNHFVQSLGSVSGTVFQGTLDQQLYMSTNLGETWVNVGGSISSGRVTAIAATDSHVVVGTGSTSGIWLQPRTQLMAPYFTFSSDLSDSTFMADEPIYVKSDQALHHTDGSVLTTLDLADFISVKTVAGDEMEFTAELGSDGKTISIALTEATSGTQYVVTVAPLKNVSGLESVTSTSRSLRAIVNQKPVVTNIAIEGDENTTFLFTEAMFTSAYADADDQPMKKIIVKTLPEHGDLRQGTTALAALATVPSEALSTITYTPNADYTGTDSWTWNAHDGFDYADSDATVNITVNVVVGVSDDADGGIRLYPVPVETALHIDNVASDMQLFLYSSTGVKISGIRSQYTGQGTVIDLSGLPSGMYVVTIQNDGVALRRRIWKR